MPGDDVDVGPRHGHARAARAERVCRAQPASPRPEEPHEGRECEAPPHHAAASHSRFASSTVENRCLHRASVGIRGSCRRSVTCIMSAQQFGPPPWKGSLWRGALCHLVPGAPTDLRWACIVGAAAVLAGVTRMTVSLLPSLFLYLCHLYVRLSSVCLSVWAQFSYHFSLYLLFH